MKEKYLTSVKISTSDNSYGTGIIVGIPRTNEYIILTCAHCVEGIHSKDDVIVEVYERENNNNIIRPKIIDTSKIVDWFCDDDKSVEEKYGVDIAAILIKDDTLKCNSTLYTDIGQVDENEMLYFQGCPMALDNDRYTNTIILEAKLEQIIDNSVEDVYQIKLQKELQNTTNSTQKQKLEGMSGGAIYYRRDSENIVIGIGQEVQSKDGEDIDYLNFYALRIKYALNRLRDKGIIIYDVYDDGKKLDIRWIKGNNFDEYDDKEILIIGGSGAGKSSFIKSFSQHREDIDSSGDGQTTRMSIEYNFSLYEREPRIEIEYAGESEFIGNRLKSLELKLIMIKYKLLGFCDYNVESEIDVVIKGLMKSIKEIMQDPSKDKNIIENIKEFVKEWDRINFENNDKKRSELIDLNRQLINILAKLDTVSLEKFTNRMRQDANNVKECLYELKDLLLVDRGFFSFKEFDFINFNDLPVLSKKIESAFENIFNTYIKDIPNNYDILIKWINKFLLDDIDNHVDVFYKNIYEIINKKMKLGKIKCKTYLLGKMNSSEKNILSKCLKVVDGQSLTSLISEIKIYDNISQEYVMIFDMLQIKRVRFIDTCGLDHVEKGEASKEIINKILAEYKDNIKTIFYVKKLDSGRPTELEKIIPNVYATQANSSLYCIFNGIDIFYDGNKYNKRIINWNDNEQKLPRAVDYITSEEGKNDMELAMKRAKIRKGRRKIFYSTLKKNLVPFCGRLDKNNNSNFIYNNKESIKKLFTSIALEENLGLEIIDDDFIIDKLNEIGFKKRLIELLKVVFEQASLTYWFRSNYGHGHHKVKEKNIHNINNENLGFNGKYNDLWSYKFKDAYNKLFSYENASFNIEKLFQINDNSSYVDKLESLIIDLKVDFLGCPRYNNDIFASYHDECEECKERCFRNILLSMYSKKDEEGNNIYIYDLKYKPQDINEEHIFLNEVCNFSKGFDYIKDDVLEYFISLFEKKIKNENNKNISRILGINKSIEESYKKLIDGIYEGFLGCTTDKNKLFDLVIEYIRKEDKYGTYK